MDKQKAIEILKREQNGRRKSQDRPFSKFPKELRNNPEVAREAVKAKGKHFCYLGEELRKNKGLLLEAAKKDKRVLKWTSDENLKKDKEFLRKYVEAGGSISSADEEVRDDGEFMLEMIAIRANVFGDASDRLQTNKDFIREAFKVAGKFEPELAFEGREEAYYNYSIKDLLRPEIREDAEFMQELKEIEKEQRYNISKEESLKGRNQHGIDEIEETIFDRTSEDISKVSGEILSEARDDIEENRDK